MTPYQPQTHRPVSPEELPSGVVPAWLHPESRAYLSHRGLTQREVEAYGLVYADHGPWQKRVIIPMYDSRGGLLAYQGRSIQDEEPRYRTEGPRPLYCPWAPAKTIRWDGRLCVVEGPFDAFAVMRVLPAVAVLGITPSAGQLRTLVATIQAEAVQAVWIWFDRDLHGEPCALALALRPFVPQVSVVSAAVKDPGEATPEQVWGAIQEACGL